MRILLGLALFAAAPASAGADVFAVTSSANSGPSTLRQALIEANTNGVADVIEFDVAGGGLQTISLLSALPQINEPIAIDGTTQPGYSDAPLIELNGLNSGQSAGLRVAAGNCAIQGLVLNRFVGGGIRLQTRGSNVVQGCYIGITASGTSASANGEFGIWISSGSAHNQVGGTNTAQRNVISGNTKAGIYSQASPSNSVQGNFIGLAANGATPVPNGNHGVIVDTSSGTVIGGSITGEGNVISGNVDSGIYLLNSLGARVQGNRIGLSANGTNAVSNSADGIRTASGSGHLIGGAANGEGNVISGNGMTGIFLLDCNNCIVQGNHLGTHSDGTQALGNSLAGITLWNASNILIGGITAEARNVISGNTQDGLFLTNSAGNRIEGNWIGLDATGTESLGNQFNGITLRGSANNTIGGITAGAGNTISGNSYEGISVAANSAGNIIQGNQIGTTPLGDVDLGNGRAGIGIWGPDTVIGGTTSGSRNLISGNQDAGILLLGVQANRTLVQGNFIGTSADGTTAIRNDREGIYLNGAGTNTIGGAAPGARNLIAGNYTRGIFLHDDASGNVIQGNWIGTQADGTSELGHRFHAIEIESSANSNLIGGNEPGEGNRLAHSKTVYSGVRVRNGAVQIAIRGNSIFANGGLGIDLGDYQPTPNDPCDPDTGANQLQNFPALTQATVSHSGISIEGELNSIAGHSYMLDFFASPTADPSGFGEGQLYLGSTTVGIPAGLECSVPVTANLSTLVPAGWQISATATDPFGNTSEFAATVEALAAGLAPVLDIELASPPNSVLLSWTNAATGYNLSMTESLSQPIAWSPVTNAPISSNGQWVVTLPIDEALMRFYRLVLQ